MLDWALALRPVVLTLEASLLYYRKFSGWVAQEERNNLALVGSCVGTALLDGQASIQYSQAWNHTCLLILWYHLP
jgi:hypothetical protein